jgi:predicted transposase YdaD
MTGRHCTPEVSQPHDTLFHCFLRHPGHAAAWVRSLLAEELAAAIDWATFAPGDTRIPGLRLRSHHADLVFTADLPTHDELLVFVVEHKSQPDAQLVPQLLRYAVHVRHVLQRRMTAPSVLPLVLHHGGRPILVPPSRLPPPLLALVTARGPRLDPLLDDLSATTEAELAARALPVGVRLCFLFLQHTQGLERAALLAAIDRWGPLLRALESAPGPLDVAAALDALGWYLVDTSDLEETDVVTAFQNHLSQPEHARMTTGQRIRQESRRQGQAEGRVEGRVEGRARTLLRQLQRRFGPLPPELEPRLLAASEAELERWAVAVLEAPTLAAVFAG